MRLRRPPQAAQDSRPRLVRMHEQDQDAIRVLLDAVIVKNQVAGAIERVARQPPAPVKAQTKARRAQAGGARR